MKWVKWRKLRKLWTNGRSPWKRNPSKLKDSKLTEVRLLWINLSENLHLIATQTNSIETFKIECSLRKNSVNGASFILKGQVEKLIHLWTQSNNALINLNLKLNHHQCSKLKVEMMIHQVGRDWSKRKSTHRSNLSCSFYLEPRNKESAIQKSRNFYSSKFQYQVKSFSHQLFQEERISDLFATRFWFKWMQKWEECHGQFPIFHSSTSQRWSLVMILLLREARKQL